MATRTDAALEIYLRLRREAAEDRQRGDAAMEKVKRGWRDVIASMKAPFNRIWR